MKYRKINFQEISTEICMITLDDEDTLNALDLEMRKELSNAVLQITNKSYKVLILNGNGKAFSAGGNIESMVGISSALEASKRLDHLHDFILKIRNWKGIVIASIHGNAAGAGLNLALNCDYIIAEYGTKFTQSFSNIGLIPDCGGLWLLPRLVGPIKAKELMLFGKSLTAKDFYELGLINELVSKEERMDRTLKMAEHISNGPTVSYGYIKQMVNDSFDKSLEQTLKEEKLIQGICMNTNDFKEGIDAFLNKRKPVFGKINN
ncbi:enoyl-CoA hydratase/isomerase family protein [Pseudogracilibacillus auburnensis]|uniref:enoyl-CoA hydratase/isomerase family protein n=1 Tax=Pseudogracilibacillus auburnensis TaxID=1494959 RepID=UPI001A95AAA1|nr:enoyl-CoA hydratase/isomerase family protein [Pseudogracilibacillus auburnensis]MBO1003183.1 enoyl-CoA hydratase/isomerase family protein [Pseudogracilibacillus auburnensis]